MIIPVSYPLGLKSPLYPGTPGITIVPEKSMANGDSANTSVISMSSHAGTHVDVPRHFCRNGRSVREIFLPINSFSPTYCVELPVCGDQVIRAEDLDEKITGMKDAVVIFINTGSWHQRATDPQTFAVEHPWVAAGVAALLRRKCPHLCMLGIDTISISRPSHRQEGRESHRAFLCDKNPILLLEDADLSSVIPKESFTLTLIPWFIDDLDGVPVTAFLRINPC
jgi:kynurenine formamidase